MEPPPPYPGISSQQHEEDQRLEARKDIERLENRDLESCSHPHELLVSITQTDYLLLSTMLHHWDCVHVRSSTSASASLAILTKLTLENLKLIHGFRDLGTFQLPATEVSGPAGLHRYLTSLIPNGNNKNPPASSDAEIISFILSCLQSSSYSSSLQTISVSVHFFTILVLSNTPEALFTGGPALAWKWAKPDAPHWQKKSGFWKPDLEDVIEDAEWSVGGGLRLLLQGVTEERKEELRRGMILFPASK